MQKATDIFADRPITATSNDKFGRSFFVKSLAKALCLPSESSGFVIAIEGGWGTGKTSILNMAESYLLTENPHPLIVRFDPWLISGSRSLTESFLIQLATVLGRESGSDHTKKAAKKVLRFAQLLGPIKLIPGVEPWGTLVQKILESFGESTTAFAELTSLDLRARKREVAESIRELGQPVIVMIDDIDRLEPAEIRQVFQLVKAVADFERVSYLLAYDPGPVFKALSYDGNYDGAAFAEKIVQTTYALPQVDHEQLRRFLHDRLLEFAKDYDFILASFEKEALSLALTKGGATQALRNIRDVFRLINRLRVSVPVTRDEVNFADIVVLEVLAIRFPNVMDAIRQRPYDFSVKVNEPIELTTPIKRGKGIKAIEPKIPDWKLNLLKSVGNERDKEILSKLLDFVFPGFFGGPGPVAEEDDLERELRVCTEIPLLKLLASGSVEGLFSARDVRKFLEDNSIRAKMINAIGTDGEIAEWIDYAESFIETASIDAPVELMELLLDLIDRATGRDIASARRLLQAVTSFLLTTFTESDDSDTQLTFLTLSLNEKCLSLSGVVIFRALEDYLRPKSRRNRKKAVRPLDIVHEGKRHWLDIIKRRSRNPRELMKELEALRLLILWGTLAEDDYNEARSFVDELFSSPDGSGVEAFVRSLHPGIQLHHAGIENLISNWGQFQAVCESHHARDTFREDLWPYLGGLHVEH